MSEFKRAPELRQRVEAKKPITLTGDPYDLSYSMAELGAKDMTPITFSPSEQVRYEENQRFGKVLVEELSWLLKQKNAINADEFHRRSSSIRQKLTPPQQAVFDGVIARLEKSLEFCQSFDPARIPEVVDALKAGKNVAKPAEITAEMRPLGIVISVINEHVYRHDGYEHGGSIPLDDTYSATISDPIIREAIKHVIIAYDQHIEHVGNAKGKEQVIQHEAFHNLYKLTIAPEQKTAYQDPVKERLFVEAKDEIIAYLLQGIWEFHPESLFLTLRRRKRERGMEIEPMGELWGMIAEAHSANKHLGDEERGREADAFIDEIWTVMRAIGFLRFAEAPCEEGVQAVLAAQSFKEIAFALLSMQDRVRQVSAEGLWESWRHKDKPLMFYHELTYFLEEYQWLRLPQLDHPTRLLELLRAYINTVSSDSSVSLETIERLEGVHDRITHYFLGSQ